MQKNKGFQTDVHCFLRRRDTPPASGKDYVQELADKMKEIGVGEIASVMGRYYAMDRDNRWDRVELAYNAMVKGEGETAECGPCAVQASYDAEKTDEFVLPTVICEKMERLLRQLKRTILLSSSTSDRTEQEKSQEHSVMTTLKDLTEEKELRQHLYALQSMM